MFPGTNACATGKEVVNDMAPPSRAHVVLIPGFGGFDALGQIEYYAGVTSLFRKWHDKHKKLVLHYFDNFPTAAVVTRAQKLERYLAKRIARGEIQPDDALVLVGHRTGGLDIRRLLGNLADPNRIIPVNGDIRPEFTVNVKAGDILKRECRVVFLSVPHWGTNIADWVRGHCILRATVIADLRAALEGSQWPGLDTIERSITGGAATLTGADLLRAVEDVLSESDARLCQGNPTCTAEAHEAASQVALWLLQMASDFRAIDDLSAQAPAGEEPRLPKGIKVRSYVTIGRRPFRFDPGKAAPRWDLSDPCAYPEVMKDPVLSKGTDVAYRFCYRACAGGPFNRATPSGEKFLSPAQQRQVKRWLGKDGIQLWDNDGIVNTASMFWPQGDNFLVPADHLDIVGHYKLAEAVPGSVRKYHSYDSLGSNSEFDENTFSEVWNDIFKFCV